MGLESQQGFHPKGELSFRKDRRTANPDPLMREAVILDLMGVGLLGPLLVLPSKGGEDTVLWLCHLLKPLFALSL